MKITCWRRLYWNSIRFYFISGRTGCNSGGKRHEIVEAIRKNGLKIIRGADEKVLKIKITENIEEAANPDLIMFTVKSYDNVTAARDCLKIIGPNTTILTLQNGVGNYETIASIVGEERTVVGTTTFGSTQYAPGCTRGSETVQFLSVSSRVESASAFLPWQDN